MSHQATPHTQALFEIDVPIFDNHRLARLIGIRRQSLKIHVRTTAVLSRDIPFAQPGNARTVL